MTRKLLVFLPVLATLLAVGRWTFFRPRPREVTATPFSSVAVPPGKKFRILHIMSYDPSWEWTQEQFEGFRAALKDLPVEYKVFALDTKRHNDKAWKEKVGKEARELIVSWRPDLVYLSDDNAQEMVTKYFLNSPIPFVFSGVNAGENLYGILGARNITGVLEQEHFVGWVFLLLRIIKVG